MEEIQALLESSKYTPLTASETAAMKLMLENTDKEQQRLVAEGTLSGDVAQFTPILMPMVRRVYPNLIANELVGTQPMSMPTGYVYSMVNHYTGTQASPIATSAIILEVADLTGADVGDSISATTDDTVADPVETGTGTIKFVDSNNAADLTKGGRLLVEVSGGSFNTGDEVNYAATVAQNTGIAILGTYSNEAAFGAILKGYTGPVSTSAAEQLSTDMKEMGFSIARKTVTAVSRALKGQYSVELYQDLKAQHGLLADEEIMSLMSYEMQAELDREIVQFVNNNAAQLVDTAFTTDTTDGGRWEIEKYRAQSIRISKEAAQIGLNTKRGQGNVLLVSPKVATMLEQVGTFKTAESNSSVSSPISGGVAGTFDGRFKVIVDQYAVSDYVTVLYKGADRRDAMGFFAPYVPMSFTKVTHADSGQPAVIAKTRYALDTIPGISSPTSNDRAQKYARSFGVNFTNTVLAG